jgi:hypothetical protein
LALCNKDFRQTQKAKQKQTNKTEASKFSQAKIKQT